MKHTYLKYFFTFFIIILFPAILFPDNGKTFGHPFFKQRSQCVNIPRRMVGELEHLFRPYMCEFNGSISLTPQYSNNFNRSEIGEYLFFNGTNTMIFGPAGEPQTDVAASQFLLGEGFEGSVTTKPRIRNVVVNTAARFGFDNWVQNLYLDVQAPFNWTQWHLDLEETAIDAGTGLIPIGQVGNNLVTTTAPFDCILTAWDGQGIVEEINDTMNYARVDGPQTKIKLADMQFALGYNFLNCDEKHLGINLRIIAPTGNRPKGVYFFEPISGGAKHTYVGGGIDGHFELYHNCCCQKYISFYFFGTFYHLFKTTQKRTFDLKNNGVGSRYLLIKRFDDYGDYDSTILRGPNILTLDAHVSVGLMSECVALFSFQRKNATVDAGYSIWARTRETITRKEELLSDHYGIKGNTNTLTLPAQSGQTSSINQTASKSRINGDFFDDFDDEPVFLSTDDIDFKGAEHPSALSHTLFGHVSFTWDHSKYLSGFWGFGGNVEISGSENTALNQWSIWTKGGIYFS